MGLSGRGRLPTLDPAFAAFLDGQDDQLAGSDEVAEPRNCVLDERVADARARDYAASGAVADHGTLSDWHGAHDGYIGDHVGLPWRGRRPPEHVSAPGDCADTFHPGAGNEASLADGLFLIHLVRFPTDRHVAVGYEEFAEALRRIGTSDTRTPEDVRRVDDGLCQWDAHGLDHLAPQWAGLWMEARELFGDSPSGDCPDWPNRLRNRLGLNWRPLGGRRVEVVLFRYRFGELPTARWTRTRPLLAVPSLLDGWLYPYFCPVPDGERAGRAVNFEAVGDAPNQEFVHPPMRHLADHVLRVGFVDQEPPHALDHARREHLDRVRAISGRSDYARGTDP